MKSVCIIVAAGTGSRMNSAKPKQFMEICGYPMLYFTLDLWQKSFVDEIIIVTSEAYVEYVEKDIVEKSGFDKVSKVICGGRERYESVYNGLKACEDADYVYIHDGVRPCTGQDVIERTREAAEEYGACAAAVPVKDTIKISDEDGFAADTPKRDALWAVQTPQAFKYPIIREAYDRLDGMDKTGITDDAMVVEKCSGVKVKLVMGSFENIKVTTPEDLEVAEAILKKKH